LEDTGVKDKQLRVLPAKSMFRLYGLLEPWFNKTWRPGDPELVKLFVNLKS